MKISILILILLQINIHAWELVCRDYTNANNSTFNEYYYDVNDKQIKFQQKYNGGGTVSANNPNQFYFWTGFAGVKSNNGRYGYSSISNVKNQLKSNLAMLDAFYRLAPQVILNFYYNPNKATLQDHINYTDYELLTDSNGLIVASIVNGKWEGLYDDDSKIRSGRLFDLNGKLAYIDGDFVGLYYEIFNFDVIPINLKEGVKIVLGISISFILGFILLRAVMSFTKYDPFKVRKIDYKKDYDK